MQLIRGVHNLPADWPGCALTIGNFDGIHRGHLALIARTAERARALKLPLAVLCFEPTPREFFAPAAAPGRISTLRTKLADFAAAGVDAVIVQRFGRPFCGLSGQEFVDQVILARLKAHAVVVGDDFVFGAQRSGNLELLQRCGAERGFSAEGLGSVCVGAQRASSTALRAALAVPDLDQAAQILGRPYRLLGPVVHGLQLGRKLDMPTANLNLRRRPAMRLGVYAVRARIDGAPRRWAGVAAIGVRPTLGITRCLLETHLFDSPGDIYGRLLDVEFRHFLRPEERFDSLDALQLQMQRDKADAMAFLGAEADN